jgi:putative ABC transport system permease protein
VNRIQRTAFRALLRLYPRAFRDAYAADMEILFGERLDASRGRGRAALWLRTVVNLIATAAAERWARRRPREGRKKLMTGFVQDARYAMRLLRRQPAHSLFVVLTLAVGIGSNAAVFSVVNGVLLKPLPLADSDRLVAVWGRFDPESGFDFPQFPLSNPEYLEYRDHTRTLAGLAAYGQPSVTVGGPGADPERVPAASVTANFFAVVAAEPLLGRTFTERDDSPAGSPVAVISYGFWKSRYGGDPAVLGRVVPLNGTATTIVGVMKDGFAYPRATTRIWIPLKIDPANPGSRKGHSIRAVGRLAPGSDVAAARVELQALMAAWKARYPDVHTGHYLFMRPLLEDVAGTVRPALLLLLAATGFVLLIVCANAASVVMARGEARTREMAIRGALGAERRRLVRLSLVESLLLAIAGGTIGVALGHAGVQALLAVDPSSMPRSAEVGLDLRVVGFAAAATVLSATLFGLAPALRGARADIQSTLKESSLSTAGGGRQWFRRGLVVAEVSLSVLLVVGAALMLRSFTHLMSVEPGFESEGLVSASVSLPQSDYEAPERVEAFYSAVIERVKAAPGVVAASAGSTVPLWTDQGVWDFEIDGRAKPGAGQMAWNAAAVVVRPGYFETLGVPIVRGRSFTAQDDARSPTVVVINQAMADRYFAGEDPLGRRIRIVGVTAPEGWMTIVGVSRDVRTEALDQPARASYHFLQSQTPRFGEGPFTTMSIVARTTGPADATLATLRTAVRELDPKLAVYDVQTAETILDRSVARPRFTTLLLTLFAVIGLVLGASGIYGVLAFTVARRTQEIGIRRALGAPPSHVVREIVTSGMAPVAVGLVIGIPASYWTSQLWRTQLFGVSSTDPVVYAGVAAGVLLVALAATLVPGRRALRVDPLVALRAE